MFRQQEPDVALASGRRPLDMVVIPRREMLNAPFNEVTAVFESALGRLRRMKETKS